jgi:hypothetical protein
VAAYIYTGETARTYPTLGIEVEPGDTVDLDEDAGRRPLAQGRHEGRGQARHEGW